MESQLQVIKSCGFLQVTDIINLQDCLELTIQSQQYSRLIIDIKKINFLDSNGLMAIISALASAREMNQQVTFYNVSREILLLFELVQIDQVFEISESAFSGGETCCLSLRT